MGEGTYAHPCLLHGVVWQKPTQRCKLNTPVRKVTQSFWREELHCMRSSSLLGRSWVLLPLLQAGRVGFQQLRVLLVGSFHSCFKSKSKAEGVEGHSWLLQSPRTNDEDAFPADHKEEILPNLAVPQGSTISTLCFHIFGPGSIPGRGTKILQALCTAWPKKKKKKKKKSN